MRNNNQSTIKSLSAEFMRRQANYLVRLEDEIEQNILDQLENDPKVGNTVITIRREFLISAVRMLKNIYQYDVDILVPEPERDKHVYIECNISW